MLSETRDMDAAKRFFQRARAVDFRERGFAGPGRFFRRARTVVGHAPEKVTADGHDAYPRAIREALGPSVRRRTSRSMNNRMEQDHRGVKQRYYPMRGAAGGVAAIKAGTWRPDARQRVCAF